LEKHLFPKFFSGLNLVPILFSAFGQSQFFLTLNFFSKEFYFVRQFLFFVAELFSFGHLLQHVVNLFAQVLLGQGKFLLHFLGFSHVLLADLLNHGLFTPDFIVKFLLINLKPVSLLNKILVELVAFDLLVFFGLSQFEVVLFKFFVFHGQHLHAEVDLILADDMLDIFLLNIVVVLQ
jgi:hypothetical protein